MVVIPYTRNQGRYYYAQIKPYASEYDVYRNWQDFYYHGRSYRIAHVTKMKGKVWRSSLPNDPTVEGAGTTREAAVLDALQQIGEG
jgi:hypothetical protein